MYTRHLNMFDIFEIKSMIRKLRLIRARQFPFILRVWLAVHSAMDKRQKKSIFIILNTIKTEYDSYSGEVLTSPW